MSLRSCRKLGFVTLVLLLPGLVSPMVSADGGHLQVVDYRSNGSTVAVTLANSDSAAHDALVTVTVRIAEDTLQASATVKVQGNSNEVAVVSFSGTVDEIILVEMTEGPDPV